jgi:hypothetical protein
MLSRNLNRIFSRGTHSAMNNHRMNGKACSCVPVKGFANRLSSSFADSNNSYAPAAAPDAEGSRRNFLKLSGLALAAQMLPTDCIRR